jgi:endogenous inhibitor of DNA gyrase (YacG/DUF329 family)
MKPIRRCLGCRVNLDGTHGGRKRCLVCSSPEAKAKTLRVTVCLQCGGPMRLGGHHGAKLCSADCKIARKRAQTLRPWREKRNARLIANPRSCAECGDPIALERNGHSVTCSDRCQNKRLRKASEDSKRQNIDEVNARRRELARLNPDRVRAVRQRYESKPGVKRRLSAKRARAQAALELIEDMSGTAAPKVVRTGAYANEKYRAYSRTRYETRKDKRSVSSAARYAKRRAAVELLTDMISGVTPMERQANAC